MLAKINHIILRTTFVLLGIIQSNWLGKVLGIEISESTRIQNHFQNICISEVSIATVQLVNFLSSHFNFVHFL